MLGCKVLHAATSNVFIDVTIFFKFSCGFCTPYLNLKHIY